MKCITKDCNLEGKIETRGLCRHCFKEAKGAVMNGVVSWGSLVESGLALELPDNKFLVAMRDRLPEIARKLDAMQKAEAPGGKIAKLIERFGHAGCTKTAVTKGTQWANARQRNNLLTDLIEAGSIVAMKIERTVGTRYWTPENCPS